MMRFTTFFIFIICFFKLTDAQAPKHIDYFIIHNVGQGQWTTHVLNDICAHYDFGGESGYYLKNKIHFISTCSQKINQLYLSHADQDHYFFLKLITSYTKGLCWGGKAIDALPLSFPQNIPFCPQGRLNPPLILFYSPFEKSKNARSLVYVVNHFLIPGDSPESVEKKWLKNIEPQAKNNIKYLILSHHGSRTANGDNLLKSFSGIRLAIASARKKKYNHPSPETISRLRKFHIPLLKTEDWGDITIY